MRPIGFSTGALAKGDYRRAIAELLDSRVRVVEVSALRRGELSLLAADFEHLELREFDFVSFHAPSRFPREDEGAVIEELDRIAAFGVPIVVHPDVIFTFSAWRHFGGMLLVENMDKRKPIGKTANDLAAIFDELPMARMCFDLGHARQIDPTMLEAKLILERHRVRLAEVHLSEVNTASRHDPISEYAVKAFQSVAHLIPECTPVVLETLIDNAQSSIARELRRAREALSSCDDRVALAG